MHSQILSNSDEIPLQIARTVDKDSSSFTTTTDVHRWRIKNMCATSVDQLYWKLHKSFSIMNIAGNEIANIYADKRRKK